MAWGRLCCLPVQEQADLREVSKRQAENRRRWLFMQQVADLWIFLPKEVVDIRSLYGFKESSWKRNPLRVTKCIETVSGSGSS